jgi:uncharacterized Rmd1/YagE family protein
MQAEHFTLLRPNFGTLRLPTKANFQARAVCVAERIDLKGIDAERRANTSSLFRAGASGTAAVFRYGCVVFFDADPQEQEAFLSQIASTFRDGVSERIQEEEVRVAFDATAIVADNITDGVIQLSALDFEKLELIADALAKSVKLAHYEAQIDEAFRRVEPLAAQLQRHGEAGREAKKLVKQIGNALLIEHQMAWRMETLEKPDLLWDRPDLERLYARLQDEYEIKERYQALEHKLSLLARTISTVLNLLHNKRSLRVEYYIVTLIVIEIALSIYELTRGAW